MHNSILREIFFLLPLPRRASIGEVTARGWKGYLYLSFRCPLNRGQLQPRWGMGGSEESRRQCSWVAKRKADGSFSPLPPTNPSFGCGELGLVRELTTPSKELE